MAIFTRHNHFVNALSFIPASSKHPNGLVVSAGSDKLIYTFDPKDPSIFTCLEGHTENVCALTASTNCTIVSGSWDKTARVWKNGKLLHVLKGHEYAIWGVLYVDDNTVLTASADKTIKIWKNGIDKKTITGHTDVVRALVLLPGLGFASCSNDGTIRTWTLDGVSIGVFFGHSSFVYSLALLPDQRIVTSGEDRTVRVWRVGECEQVITQPCISVWSICVLGNGDICVGGSDGVLRVFTADSGRFASQDMLDVFESSVASSEIPSNQVGDVDKSKLSGVEGLAVDGKKEGEVKMINHGKSVIAYQWGQNEWHKIGEVVDAVGSRRKQIYNGVEYDYVFDVDIQEGAPPLKLPYNTGENPYVAAQEFITRNELNQDYLEQVATFITTNAKNVTLGEQMPASNGDPFTGGGRYVPQGQQSTKSSLIPLVIKN
jgi:phospholipase A-2-activating protein